MASTPTNPVRLVVAVMLTCAVAGAGLSVTYAATADRIAEQEREALARALASALGPEAGEDATFTEVDEGVLTDAQQAAGDVPVEAVFRAENAGGDLVGWGVRVAPRGYGGPVRMVVGLDSAGKVTGVTVVSHGETPGLGDRVVTSDDYLGSFVGIESPEAASAVKGIDAMTGATKSSRSVRYGVVAAGAAWTDVLQGEGGQ